MPATIDGTAHYVPAPSHPGTHPPYSHHPPSTNASAGAPGQSVEQAEPQQQSTPYRHSCVDSIASTSPYCWSLLPPPLRHPPPPLPRHSPRPLLAHPYAPADHSAS